MLDSLTQRLSKVIKTIRGQSRLTETNIQDALREVRMALLEADVALPVVKAFITEVKTRALGQEVLESLTPSQALVGIVFEELKKLMGNENAEINLSTVPPAIILMAGLQGSGKTTTSGKLAKLLKEQNKKKVLLVSCDVYRPAAMQQLKTIGEQLEIDYFDAESTQKPLEIATTSIDYARKRYYDVVIIDTAGRLTVDEFMMNEIRELQQALNPIETFFVVDAMQGQDAVNTAKAFNDTLTLTGVVLTKMDGDARGGAALSVRHVTGKPIKFIGVAEKMTGLERFHPDRMAQRVLGMGDILTLVENAQSQLDQEQVQKLTKKLKSGKDFDLEDFRMQLRQMKKMGGLAGLMDKLPAQIGELANQVPAAMDDKVIHRIEGIINSMTPKERSHPEIIKASRKRRIAAGSGVTVQEVNRLLKQFEQTQKMMRAITKGGITKMIRNMKNIMPGMMR